MKTKLWLSLGGIVAAVLDLCLWGGFSSTVAVEAAPAKMGSIREFVDEQAKTRLPQTYLITMPITGRIEAIGLVEGDRVEKGKVVAQIVPHDLTLAVEQARAAVQRLEASIHENAYDKVEETVFQQAEQFVLSLKAAVQAAAERMIAGKAKLEYADHDLARVRKLASTAAPNARRPGAIGAITGAKRRRLQAGPIGPCGDGGDRRRHRSDALDGPPVHRPQDAHGQRAGERKSRGRCFGT